MQAIYIVATWILMPDHLQSLATFLSILMILAQFYISSSATWLS